MADIKCYAYYSKIQENIIKEQCIHNKKKGVNNYTNIYQIQNSEKQVEVTNVIQVKNNNDPYEYIKNTPFKDMKYLGIVEKWIKVGKCI